MKFLIESCVSALDVDANTYHLSPFLSTLLLFIRTAEGSIIRVVKSFFKQSGKRIETKVSTSLSDDNSKLEPPDPISNSAVKRLSADGSVGVPM